MTKPKPRLSREALHASLLPPNNCRVKAFRDALDADSAEILDEALGYPKTDYPAAAVRDFLLGAGYSEDEVPGVDAINDHRAGRRPCRCRG